MRIEIGNFKFATGKDKEETIIKSEIGMTGVSRWKGFLQEEYNVKLRGQNGITIYDKMRRSDGQVKKMLLAATLPIRSAQWFVQPASYDITDIEIAHQISNNLFGGMSITYDDFLRQALNMLPFGYSLFEKVFKIENGQVMWQKFAPRLQKTLLEWRYDENDGYAGFIQQINGKKYEYEADNTLRFTLEQEGSNFEGISILRPAYKHWYMKEAMYRIMNIALEKQGVGIPIATVPKGATQDEIDKVKTLIKRMQANEEAGITLKEGFELEILEGKINAAAMQTYINHHDDKIMDCILAGFLERGKEGSGGSYNMAETQGEIFLLGLDAIAGQIQDVINRFAIKQLVAYNWPNVTEFPTLEHKGITKFDAQKVAETLQKLVQTKVIIPDDELEAFMRDSMDLPEIPEENKGKDRTQENPKIEVVNPKDKTDDAKKKKEMRFREDTRPEEAPVNFTDIESTIDENEDILKRELVKIVRTKMIPEIKDQARNIIKSLDLDKAAAIEIPYSKQYENKIKEVMVTMIREGKGQVASENDFNVSDMERDDLDEYIRSKSKTLADLHIAEIKARTVFRLTRIIERKKFDEEDDLRELEAEILKKAEIQAKQTADRTIHEAMSKGRTFALLYAARLGLLNGYMWSAYLDDRICPLCMHLDGLTVRAGDFEFREFEPPVHGSCRCIWIGVNLSEDSFHWEHPAPGLVTDYGEMLCECETHKGE